jgi:hypothetical protein
MTSVLSPRRSSRALPCWAPVHLVLLALLGFAPGLTAQAKATAESNAIILMGVKEPGLGRSR